MVKRLFKYFELENKKIERFNGFILTCNFVILALDMNGQIRHPLTNGITESGCLRTYTFNTYPMFQYLKLKIVFDIEDKDYVIIFDIDKNCSYF